MKLELGKMLDAADTFLFTAQWVAVDEHGEGSEIVYRIQQLRNDLAEARRELSAEKVYA